MTHAIFGNLTFSAFLHGPIETFGALTVILGAFAAVALVLYFRLLPWLWREYLTSLDAKKIGIMYLVLSFIMLVRGGIDALMMRGQQAIAAGQPGYLSPDHFAQVFTAHGDIMIFFVAMTMMFGIINCVLPLQLGARDVAFPFLNSVSFWLTAAGAMLMNLSLVIGAFAATGWLAYPPLSELQYSPGPGVDYFIWALQLSGIGTTLAAINFIVTIIKLRAPGMTWMRLPVFAWTTLGSMMLALFAFPILTVTLALLSLDRLAGSHFFTTNLGGNVMMYVNLIWAWGHPEVYILILPAFGIFSEIVPVFSGKRLFGYTSMVVATMVIVALSYLVWLHHFFTMGAGADVNAFFGIMTMAIAIPTGVKVFNWLFTMFRGRIVFPTPMLWFLGFVGTFLIGGMTGVLMAVPGADFELHNSLFLVAHFHNMVIGGVLFGYFCGLSYWFPKIFGFRLNEKLGKVSFWLWLVGFLTAFVPLYVLGIMGATRRLVTYDPSLGWQGLFIVAAVGVVIIAAAVASQLLQLFVSIRDREKNRDTTGDLWNGRTLEWSVPSPAPEYNFAVIPTVTTRDAWWHEKQKRTSDVLGTPEVLFQDIELPKNSPLGIVIAFFAFLAGFGVIWHIWWLVGFGLLGSLVSVIIRTFDENTEYTLFADEVAALEQGSTSSTV